MDKVSTLIAAGVVGLASQSANAITFDFRYDYDSNNFFSSQARKNVLESAGSYFENILTDNLTAITSSGGNHFNAQFDRPDTDVLTTENDFSVAADTLVVYVGGRNISGSTLGQGGPGGFSASGVSQAFFDNFETRGQGSNNSDFGPWGGTISFDTNSVWYFDADVNTSADIPGNANDFYSVALHELGHVLGFGTSNTWNALHAGSHWASGTTSLVNGVQQEAAMDPSITTGTRKHFTDLDVDGLEDIGWEVSAVPVPAAVYLLGSALIGLVGFRRKS